MFSFTILVTLVSGESGSVTANIGFIFVLDCLLHVAEEIFVNLCK